MIDDIVTRLRLWASVTKGDHVIEELHRAADEIERLRTLLDNALERENKDNLRQLETVRKVEADRDRWKAQADNQTLRDHRVRVVSERNELLRKVEAIQARIDELTKQLAGLWKVDND